jgi:hypothetical protein
MIRWPFYLPEIAPADLLLNRREMLELAGLLLSQESIKKNWDGVVRIVTKKKKKESETTIPR